MAIGETFAVFLESDPLTTALPLPAVSGDRLAIVRAGSAYYVSPSSVGTGAAGTVVADTLTDLALIDVPAATDLVLVRSYATGSLEAPAWYQRVASDPGIPMAGQDSNGAWFQLVETVAEPEMAGALGDNTGDDAPAFSRLLQSGSRTIRGRAGATYRVAQITGTLQAMRNNSVPFDAIIFDMRGTTIVLSCDAGGPSYAASLSITGEFGHLAIWGGVWEYSSPPFTYGTVSALGVGVTAADAWVEYEMDPALSAPTWTNQTVRILDKFDLATRTFVTRAASEGQSGGSGADDPGFPITLVGPGTYRVDLQNALPNLAEGLAIRDEFIVGDLIGLQHRRDISNVISVLCDAHTGSTVDIKDVVVYHGCGSAAHLTAVDGGGVANLQIIPKLPNDIYSTNPGGFRLQNCRGVWTFENCVGVYCGDDAYIMAGTPQQIVDTPTTDPGLGANQLRLLTTAQERSKPLVGDAMQPHDWLTGAVDESDTWIADVVPTGTTYVITLSQNVNPAWTPTGVGTGWVIASTSVPQIFVTNHRVERNRGSGWMATNIAAGSLIDITWGIDNARDVIAIGNPYPAQLNGIAPREISAHVGLVKGGNSGAGVTVGGFASDTRADAADASYTRDNVVVIDAVQDVPQQVVEMLGCTNVSVRINSIDGFAADPNLDNPETRRAIYGENCVSCNFSGAAISALSRWDVKFIGGSGNTLVSPPQARNWTDNSLYTLIALGDSIAVNGQDSTFDRWLAHRNAGGYTVSRQAGFDDDQYCMRGQRDAGDASANQMKVAQQIRFGYLQSLRSKYVIFYLRVRGGANLALAASSELRGHIITGTTAGETIDLGNNTDSGLTGGIITVVNPLPAVVPTTDGAIYDFITQPFLVLPNVNVLAFDMAWTTQAVAAGADDYVEFSPVYFVVVGEGYDTAPNTTDIGMLTGQATVDPGNLADGAGESDDVTVIGAALGDLVEAVSFSLDLQGLILTGYVRTADTVSVRFQNETGGPIDLGSGTVRVRVRRATA